MATQITRLSLASTYRSRIAKRLQISQLLFDHMTKSQPARIMGSGRDTKALVFDTTSANSGWKSGAAVLLEERLHTKVFYLACRHHVYELIIKAVWK